MCAFIFLNMCVRVDTLFVSQCVAHGCLHVHACKDAHMIDMCSLVSYNNPICILYMYCTGRESLRQTWPWTCAGLHVPPAEGTCILTKFNADCPTSSGAPLHAQQFVYAFFMTTYTECVS